MSDLWFYCSCGRRVDWPARMVKVACRGCRRSWIQASNAAILDEVAPTAQVLEMSDAEWDRLCYGQ